MGRFRQAPANLEWLRFTFMCQPHNARSRHKSSQDQTSQGWNLFDGYTDTSRRLADDVGTETHYDVVGGVDGLETEVADPETIG